MMYVVIVELIPNALESRTRGEIASSFMAGFGLMALVQMGLWCGDWHRTKRVRG
ncbi:MAG: hypothetical protein O7E54_00645 [Planctomycetota bacterium]|nr:hypothetical protein [Planctomycetota bacterium]